MNKAYFFLLLISGGSLFGMENTLSESHKDSIIEYSRVQINHLMEKYPDDINCHDENGVTPLMYAVTLNDLVLVQNLVDNGATISQATPIGHTASILAALLGYDDITEFFLNS